MLTWPNILRLGLVQAALGSIVVLTNGHHDRVMTVEAGDARGAAGAAGVGLYATQFLRPHFGHGADKGGRRTPWIIGGVAVLAAGAIAAALSVNLMGHSPALGIAAAGTVLHPDSGWGSVRRGRTCWPCWPCAWRRNGRRRRAVRCGPDDCRAGDHGDCCGQLLDPYSPARLVGVTAGVCAVALGLTLFRSVAAGTAGGTPAPARDRAFAEVARAIWADPRTRAFTLFVFASMTAYNLQDLILEPFAGHVFGMTVGERRRWAGCTTQAP